IVPVSFDRDLQGTRYTLKVGEIDVWLTRVQPPHAREICSEPHGAQGILWQTIPEQSDIRSQKLPVDIENGRGTKIFAHAHSSLAHVVNYVGWSVGKAGRVTLVCV